MVHQELPKIDEILSQYPIDREKLREVFEADSENIDKFYIQAIID